MKHKRTGVVLLELIVACGLMAVLVTLSVQLLTAAATQRRAVDQRSLALAEAANVAEQISGLAWDELTAERLSKITLSPAAQQSLPQGKLLVTSTPDETAPAGQRITIEITWHAATGEPAAPVRVNLWAYRPAGGGAA